MKERIQFPDDENGDVLRRFQRDGDCFEIPRDVNFSVVFPSESAAFAFVAQFERIGLRVTVKRSDLRPERPWDVTVVKSMALSWEAITAFENALEEAADPLGGENDGWGCFTQKLRN